MFEIITSYPVFVILAIFFIVYLFKNHVLTTPFDVKKAQDEVIQQLKKVKSFVTHEELSNASDKIKKEVEDRFLTLAVFNEFKAGIDKQFETVFKRFDEGNQNFKEIFRGINEIKTFLIKGGK